MKKKIIFLFLILIFSAQLPSETLAKGGLIKSIMNFFKGGANNVIKTGDDAIKNMPRGDLMVLMSVLDSDVYTRKGYDLYTDNTIDCFQAVRGTDFNLKTLDNNIIKVKVPAGTHPNTILQVQGKGMPVHKTIGIRGNLYVKIHVLIPQLSANDLKKI